MPLSDLSRFEWRIDVRISTLRACLEALGGRLRVLCEVRGKSFEIRPGAPPPAHGPGRRHVTHPRT
jgi:hypothetical protein